MGLFDFLSLFSGGSTASDRARRDQNRISTRLKNALSPINDYGHCFKCNGSGTKVLDCGPCDGTGERTFSCRSCEGTGTWTGRCKVCEGTGVYSGICSTCHGTGTYSVPPVWCRPCQASGWLDGRGCPWCFATGNYKRGFSAPCRKCEGSGKYAAPCRKCNEVGTFTAPCRKCEGRGEVTKSCNRCDGDGRFSVSCNRCGGSGWKRL